MGPVIGRGKGNEKGLSCYLLVQHLRCTLRMYFQHYHEVKRKCDLISHKPREMYSDLDIFFGKGDERVLEAKTNLWRLLI